ncbi:hypothetical protein BJ508DRAFT_304017 [Ascobolus immersus RN42]|uniref:Uncharacterized protein n=1 Tax=Ascobolus immersus RN42 TaxID=1160509 RepID=A0A3N4IRI3_ASCIM|nr:hypothetical protein BJ508DRAFT_304017 [Ascobolus immersus RN42]
MLRDVKETTQALSPSIRSVSDETDPSAPPAYAQASLSPTEKRRVRTIFCLHNEYCHAGHWADPSKLKITKYEFPADYNQQAGAHGAEGSFSGSYRIMEELGKAGAEGRACLEDFVRQQEVKEGKRLVIKCLKVHTCTTVEKEWDHKGRQNSERMVVGAQTLFVELEEMEGMEMGISTFSSTWL